MEFATVVLKLNSDTSQIFWGITKQDGSYSIQNLQQGNYLVGVEMIGFASYKSNLILEKDTDFANIILQEDATLLKAFEISTDRSLIENQLGKKVLILGNDLSATGSSVAEVMLRIPSVTSTPDGNVQIRGSSNFIIYINGKETKRKASSFKYIPAESIERVEVITNPSAKYDAEGSGGVINIVFKKNAKKPFKLDVNANLIFPTRRLLGLNLGVNKSKFSFFANLSANWGRSETLSEIRRENQFGELETYLNNTIGSGEFTNYAINTGISYQFDSTASLELSINYNRWDDKDELRQNNLFQFRNEIAQWQFQQPDFQFGSGE